MAAHAAHSGGAKADPRYDAAQDIPAASGSRSPTEAMPQKYVLSLRPSVGVGAGQLGGAERVGLAGEYWINDTIGAGLVGAVMQQQTGALIDLGPGTWSAAWVVVPTVALRSAPGPSYFAATLGAGFASGTRQAHGGILCFTGCGADHRIEYTGYALEASVGWLAHPGRSSFEIGPVVRFDVVGDFAGRKPIDFLATLNLELGFAFLGG